MWPILETLQRDSDQCARGSWGEIGDGDTDDTFPESSRFGPLDRIRLQQFR